MLKTHGEITKRLKTSSHFARTYIDKLDVDVNAKPKEKDFVPSSLRNKMPLNYSKDVKKDSRCGSNLSALTTLMEQGHQCHEQYKITMSAIAQKCAEEELKAMHFMLAYKYAVALLVAAPTFVTKFLSAQD